MSNSGVNTGFAKCFIFFMAIVILLQGIVYLGLSIWGITLRECQKEVFDVSNKPFQFAMNLIYFMNEDCGNPVVSISVAEVSNTVTLQVDFDKAERVVNRTFIIFITYAVISAIWVVTSLTVITTLCGRVTRTINALCFWPWFLAVIAGCILDVVATGYFVHDIINTTSVNKTFDYLGITTNEKVFEWLANFDAYFITPSVVMTCISSRVVLIWLLNIFGSSFCLSLSNILSNRNSSKQSSVNSLATTSTAPVTNSQQQAHENFLDELQEQQHLQQTQQQSQVTAQQEPQLIRPKPLQIQRQSSTPLQANQNTRPYNLQSPIATGTDVNPSAPPPNEQQAEANAATTYRSTETHPDRLNYPTQQQSSPYQHELSPISPLNSRYSTNNDSFQFPMQNQRVSDELRGQLPWSYTSIPPPVPKKPQLKVYPEIPAPDYGQ